MIYIMFILGFPKQAGFICAQLLALLFLRNSTEYENRCTQFRATEFRLETIVYTALYSILVCSHYIYYLQYFKWKLELPVSPLSPPSFPLTPPFLSEVPLTNTDMNILSFYHWWRTKQTTVDQLWQKKLFCTFPLNLSFILSF